MRLILSSLSLPDTPSTILCLSLNFYSINSVFTASGPHVISVLREARDPLGWSCGTFPWVLRLSLSAQIPLKSSHCEPHNIPSLCPAALHPPPPSLWPHPSNSAPGTPASSFSLCLLCDLLLSLLPTNSLPSPPGLSCLSCQRLCAWRDPTRNWFKHITLFGYTV